MEFRQTDPYHSRKRNSNENRLDIIGDAFSRLKQDFSDSKKYITQENEYTYKVADEVKRCVEFKQHNLLKDPYPSDCDLIVCRNVLIYFTEEAKTEIYKKFNTSLKKDGVLFVGSTEQIIQANTLGYATAKSFFYRKV